MPRDGRLIEQVGRYNPLTTPKTIELDLEKIDAWVAKGAQPTNAVAHLIDIARGEAPEPKKREKKSKKQLSREAAAAEEAAAAAEAAAAEEAAEDAAEEAEEAEAAPEE